MNKIHIVIIFLVSFALGFLGSYLLSNKNEGKTVNVINEDISNIKEVINIDNDSFKDIEGDVNKDNDTLKKLKEDINKEDFVSVNFLSDVFIQKLYNIIDKWEFVKEWKYIPYDNFISLNKNISFNFIDDLARNISFFNEEQYSKKECIKYWNDNFDSLFIDRNKEYFLYKNLNQSPLFNNNSFLNDKLFSLLLKIHYIYPKWFIETKDITFVENISCNSNNKQLDKNCNSFNSYIKQNIWIDGKIFTEEYSPNISYINYVNKTIDKKEFISDICSYERN